MIERGHESLLPPDRAEWRVKYGTAPKPIRASAVFLKRAAALVAQDAATYDPAEMERVAKEMDYLCGSVRYAYHLDVVDTVVFYDPSEKTFYAYSRK